MHQQFPKTAANMEEFLNTIDSFVIYFFQGVRALVKFWRDRLYFGDCKPENFLVSFKGMRFLLGDFGVSMLMNDGYNYVRGCTVFWSLP